MPKLFKYIMLLILTGSLFACSNREHKSFDFKTELLTFPADGALVNSGYTQLIESDSNNYLITYNGFTRDYELINFPEGGIFHKFHLDREGENGVRRFRGGSLTSTDSIWFVAYPPSIGLTDLKGNILFRKEIIDDKIPLQQLVAYPDKKLYKYKNKIFGTQNLFTDHHGMEKEDIQKHRLIYSFNIKSDSIEWYDVNYSPDYWKDGKKIANFSWTRRNDKLYIAPWYDHEIQVFDLNLGKVVNKKEVKSTHVNSFLYVNEIPSGSQNGLLNFLLNDQYKALLYDQYRDVFYRLFFPSSEMDEISEEFNFRDLVKSRPYMGVMVLDSELNIIGEHIFDKFQIYTQSNHFVGKKGLYLSMNNLFDPNYDEEMFRYLIFTPELGER
ncbi:DUF4221 family protein [uncultured Cyclobacterium sp.]|uniref:DUF4221 family protein n=1 Tax=uncultured Cyclobacterium sp. TaxID=453820 RepID=UPI0030EDFD3C